MLGQVGRTAPGSTATLPSRTAAARRDAAPCSFKPGSLVYIQRLPSSNGSSSSSGGGSGDSRTAAAAARQRQQGQRQGSPPSC